MPHGRKCLVCKNTRHRDRNLRLFRFPPRDSPLWARWLQACGLTDADIDSNGGREPPRLCHRHFQPKDFLTRQLSGTAVPSISVPKVLTTDVSGGIEPEPEVVEDQCQMEREQQVIEEVLFKGEVEPEQLIEFNESIDESLGEVELDMESLVTVEEVGQSLEEPVDDIVEEITCLEKLCKDENHKKLLQELQAERAKVELLKKELEEKDKVLTGQQELLSQLGVKFVIYTNSN